MLLVKPQSMYSKLLGCCVCYSLICNVPQKNNGLPSFINYFTVINLFYFLEELSVLSLLLSLLLNV